MDLKNWKLVEYSKIESEKNNLLEMKENMKHTVLRETETEANLMKDILIKEAEDAKTKQESAMKANMDNIT